MRCGNDPGVKNHSGSHLNSTGLSYGGAQGMKTPPGNSLEELKDGDPLNPLKTVLGIEPISAKSAKTPLGPNSNSVCSVEFLEAICT